MKLLIVFSFLACLVAVATHTSILVRPENSSVCDYNDKVLEVSNYNGCDTLAHIVRNSSPYFASGSIDLLFLPGVHYLDNDFSLQVVDKEHLELSSIGTIGTPTIQCRGSAGIIFRNITCLSLHELIINECGTYFDGEGLRRAALRIENTTHLEMVDVIIQSSRGYGLSMLQYGGEVSIYNCVFKYNSGMDKYAGGNANLSFPCHSMLNSTTGSTLTIISTEFLYGNFGYDYPSYPMASGLLIHMCSGVSINIDNTTLEGNFALTKNIIAEFQGSGGNLALILEETGNSSPDSTVVIQNTQFINGTAGFGGGILFNSSSLRLNVSNCLFENNHAVFDGGAVYCHISHRTTHKKNCLVIVTHIKFDNCNFSRNMIHSTQDAGVGIAFSIVNAYVSHIFSKVSQAVAHIHKCKFTHNSLMLNKDGQASSTTSVFLVSEQLGETVISDSMFSDNDAPAIAAILSDITFSGSIRISSNNGTMGAGITLCEASYIILYPNTTVYIDHNTAVLYGGGIYVETICSQSRPLCFFQLDSNGMESYSDEEIVNSTHIYLVNNTAGAGSQLYGGNIEFCYMSFGDVAKFHDLFTVETSPTDFSNITSAPEKVCFCIDEQTQNCSLKNMPIRDPIFSGQEILVHVVIVGQMEGRVQGSVNVSSIYNSSSHFEARVDYVNACKNISIRVYSLKYQETFRLTAISTSHNTLIHGPNAVDIVVPIQKCPLGFEATKENPACHCSSTLQKHKVMCDIDNKVIKRRAPTWIGYHVANESNIKGTIDGVIYHYNCPQDYCSQDDLNISTDTSSFLADSQCAYNRSGLLCGRCEDNLTMAMSSTACRDCSGYTLPIAMSLLLAMAAGGIVLVIVLFVCNFTVTEGTMSGLIFYANIFAAVSPTLLTNVDFHFTTDLVVAFLSWLNLDTGIEFCLYHSVDLYEKIWGYFIFPVYLWTISGLIILLCKQYTWVARLAGKNAVPVLATILLLSYVKINQGVIYAFSYTTVHYPGMNNSVVPVGVWAMDATVTYLAGKHIPLFIAGVVFGTLSVIYTAALLFIRPLQKISHFKCFQWVNKLTPLIDAYSCPHIIEQRKQFWNGLLLLTRGILCVIITLYGNDWPMLSLATIIITCSFLCVLSWLLGGIYKKRYLNLLCSLFLLNLIAVSTITLCLRNMKDEDNIDKYIAICSTTSVFIAMLLFTGITLLHSYKLVKRLELTPKLSRFVCPCCIRKPPPGYQRLPDVVIDDADVTYTTVSFRREDYREPQLADFDTNTMD